MCRWLPPDNLIVQHFGFQTKHAALASYRYLLYEQNNVLLYPNWGLEAMGVVSPLPPA